MLKSYIALLLFSCIADTAFAQVPEAAEIKNNKIKKITTRYDGYADVGPVTQEYYYDENGYDTAFYDQGIRNYYKTIGYNRKLQPLMIKKYFPSGTEMETITYSYKPDGSYITLSVDKQFGMKVTDTYDTRGHLLSHTIPDGTVWKYVYNAKGQLTSSYSIPVQGEKKTSRQYTYNAKGKIISSLNKEGFLSRSVYKYNEKGLLSEIITTAVGGASKEKSVTTQKYEYSY